MCPATILQAFRFRLDYSHRVSGTSSPLVEVPHILLVGTWQSRTGTDPSYSATQQSQGQKPRLRRDLRTVIIGGLASTEQSITENFGRCHLNTMGGSGQPTLVA